MDIMGRASGEEIDTQYVQYSHRVHSRITLNDLSLFRGPTRALPARSLHTYQQG